MKNNVSKISLPPKRVAFHPCSRALFWFRSIPHGLKAQQYIRHIHTSSVVSQVRR